MWYRLAIKPNVPNDVFKEYVRQSIPRPISQIETGLGDQHLILTGTGDLHQGVSHSMFLNRVLDEARWKINQNTELQEQYKRGSLSNLEIPEEGYNNSGKQYKISYYNKEIKKIVKL
jgi:hypothetical protein